MVIFQHSLDLKDIFFPSIKLNQAVDTGYQACCWVWSQLAGPKAPVLLSTFTELSKLFLSTGSDRHWQKVESIFFPFRIKELEHFVLEGHPLTSFNFIIPGWQWAPRIKHQTGSSWLKHLSLLVSNLIPSMARLGVTNCLKAVYPQSVCLSLQMEVGNMKTKTLISTHPHTRDQVIQEVYFSPGQVIDWTIEGLIFLSVWKGSWIGTSEEFGAWFVHSCNEMEE